jgi:hypothetical protein
MIRKKFLELEGVEDLRTFLEATGRFSIPGESFTDLKEWQELVWALMRTDPRNWAALKKRFDARKLKSVFLNSTPSTEFQWTAKFPALELQATCTLGAIVAITEVDHLRGAEFRLCRNPDCRQMFEVQSRHGQMYCTYQCAHRINMRTIRAKKPARRHRKKGF